jgi:CRISPR-associated endonuclease/helicase Cas3
MNEARDPLRPFQKKIFRFLLQGKNVIVCTPPGTGKTWGSLAAYFQNLARGGQALPWTCLYATPLRVLSTQFYTKYSQHIQKIDQQKGTDFRRLYKRLERSSVSIQTGEQPGDPAFEALLTFCTIDQLLASFLGVPYSLGSRFANLNVGAIISSFLVFDEFHLFPLTRSGERCFGARTTTLALLQALAPTTRFVLMTATFSTHLLEELKQLLPNTEIVTLTDEEELQALIPGRKCRFEVSRSPMNPRSILDRHQQCSLVVCNTVLRAQETYRRLKPEADRRGIELVLLHSRLEDKDRKQRSLSITHQLGPAPGEWEGDDRYGWKGGQYYGKNLIVVATQVIEVGLDISVQTLHTEIAPANSVIQRAGRCARFAYQDGTVIIYDLPITPAGFRVSAKPYDEALCTATFDALEHLLQEMAERGEDHVTLQHEQTLVDTIHTEEDRELLLRFRDQQSYIRQRLFESLRLSHSSVVSELIRDVAQVQIIVHDDPLSAIQTAPWQWQSFAMHPASLARRLKILAERAKALRLPWICKKAEALTDEQNPEEDARQQTRFTWIDVDLEGSVQQVAERLQATLMLALPTQLATYDPDLGFVLLDGSLDVSTTGYQSSQLSPKPRPGSSSQVIEVQSYQQHIQGLVQAYNSSIRPLTAYALTHLEAWLDLPPGSIDQAIRLALACHDLGKLSNDWQRWANAWQQTLYEKKKWPPYQTPKGADTAFLFAKTDYDGSPEHRQWQRDLPIKRPRHACESVVIGMNLIADSLEVSSDADPRFRLLFATLAAIARHHSPHACTYEAVQLHPEARAVVQAALEQSRQGLSWRYDLTQLDPVWNEGGMLAPANDPPLMTIPSLEHEGETWLYFFLARVLRLADQRADRFRDNR